MNKIDNNCIINYRISIKSHPILEERKQPKMLKKYRFSKEPQKRKELNLDPSNK